MKHAVLPEIVVAFRKLSVAIRILSEKKLVEKMNGVAYQFIVDFQRILEEYFGEHFTSLAVHKLLHLPGDCLHFGILDSFSCFRFENVLGKLKRDIMNAKKKPLVTMTKKLKINSNFQSQVHFPGFRSTAKPIYSVADQVIVEGQDFEFYYGIQWKVKLDDTDENGHFSACNGRIFKLNHITYYPASGEVELESQEYQNVEAAFELDKFSLKSNCVGIYKVSGLSNRIKTLNLDDFEYKFVHIVVNNEIYLYKLI